LERAFEPGSGEPGVANVAGWPAGAWDDPVHEQLPKGGLSPVTEYAPGTGGRDSAAFRPLSSCCQGSGTLDMSAPTLSVSAIVLSLSTGACWSPPLPCAGGWAGLASSRGLPDGRTGAELLLCAPGGAVNVLTGRTGALVKAPTLSVCAIVLSLSTGACWSLPVFFFFFFFFFF
jgi:hypothetical protein